jgi:hypothetical protein
MGRDIAARWAGVVVVIDPVARGLLRFVDGMEVGYFHGSISVWQREAQR